jgi:hypothetical protein
MLRHAEITFDVHCYYKDQIGPRYRVYVDNDLITERTFDYGTNFHVEETVIIEAFAGRHHFRVENVDPTLGTFVVENLKVDGIDPGSNASFEIA